MILYHYTNAAAALSILVSQTIRASDVEFLNDSQEIRFGRDQLISRLKERSDQLATSDPGNEIDPATFRLAS
jgi:hypothetical protein